MTKLEAKFRPPHVYALYGDPAYLLAPYEGVIITREQQVFNQGMSKVCVSVEWAFGKVVQYFAFLDFKKHLKILLQPIGKYYAVGVILNCHTCIYGSVTSSFFMCHHPLSITVIYCHVLSSTVSCHLLSFTIIYRYLL